MTPLPSWVVPVLGGRARLERATRCGALASSRGTEAHRSRKTVRPLQARFIQTHSWRRLQMPSAARSASAPIVDVGLTAALVVNELPSTTKRFGTSWA